jgi:hypothetical protein
MTVYRLKRGFESALTPDVKANRADAVLDDYKEVADDAASVDLNLISRLLEEGLSRELERDGELDRWLAPRLHFALRVPRRVAGDPSFWSWMVMEVGRRYTWHRWNNNGDVTLYRYNGDFKRNALARLWWFAEMARNGPSYEEVARVLRDPSTAQYAMELRYSMYRPAVIAFGRTAANLQLGFEAMKALSRKINAYLSLRSLEALGLAESDGQYDADWWNDRPTLGEVLGQMPLGPRDDTVGETVIADLEGWFTELATQEHAPI